MKRVLIVDDDKFNINLLKGYFKKVGITDILVALNGEEAFEIYRE